MPKNVEVSIPIDDVRQLFDRDYPQSVGTYLGDRSTFIHSHIDVKKGTLCFLFELPDEYNGPETVKIKFNRPRSGSQRPPTLTAHYRPPSPEPYPQPGFIEVATPGVRPYPTPTPTWIDEGVPQRPPPSRMTATYAATTLDESSGAFDPASIDMEELRRIYTESSSESLRAAMSQREIEMRRQQDILTRQQRDLLSGELGQWSSTTLIGSDLT